MQPTDAFIAQALEEFVADTQHLLDAAQQQKPRDRQEIAFWRRQANAFHKAQYQFLHMGVRLQPTPSGWLIPSASNPGSQIHRAIQHGGVWVCSCKAGELSQFHWHVALIAAYERGAELEALAEDAAEARLHAAIVAARAKYAA